MRQVALDLCSRPLVDARLGVDALREESFADRLLAALGRLLVARQEYAGLHGLERDGVTGDALPHVAQRDTNRIPVAGACLLGRVGEDWRATESDSRSICMKTDKTAIWDKKY